MVLDTMPPKVKPLCKYLNKCFVAVTSSGMSIEQIEVMLDGYTITITEMLDDANLNDDEILTFLDWIHDRIKELDVEILKDRFNFSNN